MGGTSILSAVRTASGSAAKSLAVSGFASAARILRSDFCSCSNSSRRRGPSWSVTGPSPPSRLAPRLRRFLRCHASDATAGVALDVLKSTVSVTIPATRTSSVVRGGRRSRPRRRFGARGAQSPPAQFPARRRSRTMHERLRTQPKLLRWDGTAEGAKPGRRSMPSHSHGRSPGAGGVVEDASLFPNPAFSAARDRGRSHVRESHCQTRMCEGGDEDSPRARRRHTPRATARCAVDKGSAATQVRRPLALRSRSSGRSAARLRSAMRGTARCHPA